MALRPSFRLGVHNRAKSKIEIAISGVGGWPSEGEAGAHAYSMMLWFRLLRIPVYIHVTFV